MKKYLLLITFAVLILFSACSDQVRSDPPVNAPTPHSESADTVEKRDIAKYAAEAKSKVGVAAIQLETGEYISLNADGHYPMQSVYKLPISMAVLNQYNNQRLDLDQKISVTKDDFVRLGQYSPIRDKFPDGTEMSVRELIKYAIEESDGTASDVLLRVAGGGSHVQSYLAGLGITDMKVINTEKELGADWPTQYENWSTPEAAVSLLKALYDGTALSSSADREMLFRFMTESKPGAGRIKALLYDDAPVAHKTGTSGTQNGITAATNDIGIVSLPNGKHMAVAVFISDSTADDKTRDACIAKITKVLWNHWKN